MTTSSANQQHISISARQAIFVDNVSFDSLLASVPAPRKIDHCNFFALQEETRDPHNVGGQDVPNVRDVHHPIPGPGEVRATSESGDVVNEQLLQNEHLDIEAVRTVLGLAILKNVITVQHYRWIVMSLRDKLLQAGPHEIPYGEAYARILLRLAGRLVALSSQQDSEYVLCLRPRNYIECLGKLITDMAEGFVVKQQTGIEDDVYIIKDKELHTDHLCSLASRLRASDL